MRESNTPALDVDGGILGASWDALPASSFRDFEDVVRCRDCGEAVQDCDGLHDVECYEPPSEEPAGWADPTYRARS